MSPGDSRVIYLFEIKGRSYRTNDCGNKFTQIVHNDTYYEFKLNKISWNWLIAFQEMDCQHSDMNCRSPYNRRLLVSSDGGH